MNTAILIYLIFSMVIGSIAMVFVVVEIIRDIVAKKKTGDKADGYADDRKDKSDRR